MSLAVSVSHTTAFSLTGTPPDGANAWNGNGAHTVSLAGVASESQGGTNQSTYTQGDILYASAANTLAKLGLGTGLQQLRVNAGATAIEWATISASATWDTIGAAAGSATTANGNNTITYNTAQTSNAQAAWTFGETSAATNGTSTSGVPNQVLLKLATLASSTQSAFQIKVRGNHLVSASPGTSQLLFTNGSSSVPPISFAAATTTGIYGNGTAVVTTSNGNDTLTVDGGSAFVTVASGVQFRPSPGTTTVPGICDTFNGATGLTFNGASVAVRFIMNGVNTASITAAAFVPSAASQITLGAASTGFGALYLDYTNTGTVGNVTINKPSGRVNLGAGGSTLTLTNSLITAASHIFLNADSAPGNIVAVQLYAVPTAGSCTINAVPVVTNQTAIDFVIINAD